MDIDALLESPYWVIDFLPYQVPAGCEGQFFKIEDYYLKPSRMELAHATCFSLPVSFGHALAFAASAALRFSSSCSRAILFFLHSGHSSNMPLAHSSKLRASA